MSITPTAGSAAPNRSGRCVMHGADEQAAVAAAVRSRASGVDVYFSRIRYSAAAMKSSKTFCFFCEPARVVPLLAVLAAAAQVRHRVDAAHLEPAGRAGEKAGRQSGC